MPQKGEVVEPFTATAVSGGGAVAVSFDSPVVLMFFLSGCPTCHKMIPEWNRAYARRPPGLTVLGVIMDQEPPGFFETMGIAFPVVRAPSRQFLQQMKVHRAPLTLRMARGGVVEQARLGLVDPITLGELFRP